MRGTKEDDSVQGMLGDAKRQFAVADVVKAASAVQSPPGDGGHEHHRRNCQETARSSRLRRPAKALGGRTLLRLDQPKQAPRQGLRGDDRFRRRIPLRRLHHDPRKANGQGLMSFETDS